MRRIEVEEVWCAMNHMKIRKGTSGVAIELLKVGGDQSLTNIFKTFFKDKLLEGWMLSSLVPIFKGKGDPLNPNSYRAKSCWNMLLNCMRFWMDICMRW